MSTFAPELYIPNNIRDVSFYPKAFGAVELRRFSNADGSVHVSEFSIDGAIFHLHEVTSRPGLFDPQVHQGTTVIVGMFVDDVDETMHRAEVAGATVISPPQDFDYGYRQGLLKDPFGHRWMIQKKI
jgi:PhnB protein